MQQKILSFISEYSQIALGVVLASLGLKAFLLPNGFLDGGVTGIAILLSEITNFDISFLLVIISAPFLLLAWFTVSKRIVIKSMISILGVAVMIHFENFEAVTEDKLLIAIFGGLFLGAGIGLAIKNGAVLDGSEILGIYINNRFGISIGRVILIFNLVLFIITALTISVEVAMYSILTYLVTAKIVDFLIEGFEDYVGLMIVSAHSNAIEAVLISEVGTGVTVYQGKRGFGSKGKQENQEIIHLVINRIDIRRTYNAIQRIDKDAFVIEFDVNLVKGGVLRHYLSKRKK
jgi:uncharacterized membrane-anchored protein YitT (DUF2179 family)